MNKIFLIFLLLNYSMAGIIKIFNIPNETEIYIDGQKYIPSDNKLIVNVKDKKTFLGISKHKLKIVNPKFHIIEREIKTNNTVVIILNKTKGFKLIPIKTYYKNIVIEFEGKKYGCRSKDIKCTAELDGKKYDNYDSFNNVYKITYENFYKNFYIKVKSKNFYSESDSDDALKDSLIILKPVSNWGLISFSLSIYYLNASKFSNKNDKSKILEDYKDEYKEQAGYSFALSYAKNLPVIDLFFYSKVQYIFGSEITSSSDSNKESESLGPVYSLGIGKRFSKKFYLIVGGNYLDLKYKNDYTRREFEYKKIQPYVEFMVGEKGFIRISITKNLYEIGLAASY